MTPTDIIRTAALAAVLTITASCGSNTWTDDQAAPPEGRGDAADVSSTETSNCADLVGLPTSEVVDMAACLDGGVVTWFMTAFYDCPDGRTLHWNDYGWGYSDGTWQAHARADGQLVPPQPDLDACQPQ